MQSKENQSHIPESDGGVKDEPWAESLAILSQPAGDRATELPVQMPLTWRVPDIQWWFPHLGQVIAVEVNVQALCSGRQKTAATPNSPLPAWATGSPPPAEGLVGPDVLAPHPRASRGGAWSTCTYRDSQLENKGSKHTVTKILVSFKLQPVPHLQWSHLRFL